MKRGDKPITRQQAIEFCRERQMMQKSGAEEFLNKPGVDVIENNVDRIKYNNRIDLANIYGDIADLLERLTASDV